MISRNQRNPPAWFPLKQIGNIQTHEVVIALIVGSLFSISPSYLNSGFFEPTWETLAIFIAYVIGLLALQMILRNLCTRQKRIVSEKPFNFKKLLFGSLIIFVCWIPYLVILYPGTLSNDTVGQFCMFRQWVDSMYSTSLSELHPLFDTFLFGSFLTAAEDALGSLSRGVFAYVVIQSMLTAIAFAALAEYSRSKLNLSAKGAIGIILFFALMPLFPICACNVSKDTLFSWLYIYFLLFFLEGLRTDNQSLKKPIRIIAFTIVCLLCILTKKFGFYVVAPSLAVMIASNLKNCRQVIAPLVACLLTMFAILPAISAAYETTPGGTQEMLSLPLQQTARYALLYPDDMTQDEASAIDDLLNLDTLAQRYDPFVADPVKGYSELGTKEEYAAWAKAYISQGLRHPLCYLDAAIDLDAAWYSFTPITPLFNSDHHTQANPNYTSDEFFGTNQRLLGTASSTLNSFYDTLSELPIIGIAFSTGLYATILPALALSLILSSKNKRYLIGLIPVVISYIGLLLSPVAIGQEAARYLLPFLYSSPLIMVWAWSAFSKKTKSTPTPRTGKRQQELPSS